MMRFAERLRSAQRRLKSAGAQACVASARQGARLARETAPVDSGRLRASISAREQGGGAAVIADAPYAAAVEFGTSRSPAQPFLLPMARRMQADFAKEAAKAVREVFE